VIDRGSNTILPVRDKGYASEAGPQNQENIMLDRLFPRVTAVVTQGLVTAPLLVPTLIAACARSRRGAHRDARS